MFPHRLVIIFSVSRHRIDKLLSIFGASNFRTSVNGGEGEIRTHETLLTSTRFRIELLRPLGHLSAPKNFRSMLDSLLYLLIAER